MKKIKLFYNLFFRNLRLFLFKNKLLTLILSLAFILRVVGFMPGYNPYHSDEGMSYSSAINMLVNINLDPGRYDYPILIPLIHAILYIFILPFAVLINFIFVPENIPQSSNIVDLFGRYIVVNQQTQVLFWARFITALFGVGVVYLVYKVSLAFFKDKRIGLVSSFMTAVNFRQVLNSHLALPDIYNSFFLLISIFATSNLYKNPSARNFFLAFLFAGFSFSTKFQIFSAFPLLIVLFILAFKNHKSSKRNFLNFFKFFASRKIIVSALFTIVFVGFIHIFYFIHYGDFKEINSYNFLKYGFGVKTLNFYPISYLYHIGIGQFAFISIFLGIFVSLRQNFLRTVKLLSVLVPFFYIFVYYSRGGYYTRNFVTITPLALIFAGVFIVWIWEIFAKRFSFRVNTSLLILITTILISLTQLENSLISSFAYLKPWEFESAGKFAAENIMYKATIVSHPWDKYPRDKDYNVITFEPSSVYSLQEMQEEDADYGFLNLDWVALGSYWWMNKSTLNKFEFWQKPNEILSNTFSAVAAQELADYSVAKFIKPWQAPDMNFLIVKIPSQLQIKEKNAISSFNFNQASDLANWTLIDGDWDNPKKIIYDFKTGRESPGSLKFEDGTRRFPVVRVMSPIFPIESIGENKVLIIEGWIKSGNILDKKNRDGFLRVDFFKEHPQEITLATRSLQSSISSRFYGGTDWTRKEIIVFIPKRAKFMSIGVQLNNFTDFWFDDIKIYQSADGYEDPRNKPPYIDYRIPDDILFPYSQGGL